MILDVAIALTWLAAAYRAWVLLNLPRTIWRTSFTLSTLSTAVAFTLYRFRLPLDKLTTAWNLTGLLSHTVFLVGAAFLLIYLDALRMPIVPRRRIGLYLSSTGVAALIMTVS